MAVFHRCSIGDRKNPRAKERYAAAMVQARAAQQQEAGSLIGKRGDEGDLAIMSVKSLKPA